jgi:hypothetical protein
MWSMVWILHHIMFQGSHLVFLCQVRLSFRKVVSMYAAGLLTEPINIKVQYIIMQCSHMTADVYMPHRNFPITGTK